MAKLTLCCVILLLVLPGLQAESHNEIPEEKQDFPTDKTEVFTGGNQQRNEAAKHEDHLRLRRSDDLGSVEAVLATHAQELSQLKAQLQAAENRLQASETKAQALETDLQATKTKLAHAEGSTFVRWGRTQCPSNTQLVYTGIAAGKHESEQGSGPNRLCLSLTPQFDNAVVSTAPARLYGSEYYQVTGHHLENVPCSVCRAPQSTTIMVPGTLTCPQDWTSQYTGHVASTYYSSDYATEYVCLDGQPEDRPGGDGHTESNWFLYTSTVCGTLPCPPYVNNKVVTCVVCSS